MPTWFIEIAQVEMAAACAVYGLVLLLSPVPKTRLTLLLVGMAFTASLVTLYHFFVAPLPGWPAGTVGIFIWIASYGAFKHRLALSHSVAGKLGERRGGRRFDD